MTNTPELWIASLRFIQSSGQGGFFALPSKYTGERTQGLGVLKLKRSGPMNLGQRKIHSWRASATLLLCTIPTGTPPAALRRCFPRRTRSGGRGTFLSLAATLSGGEPLAGTAPKLLRRLLS